MSISTSCSLPQACLRIVSGRIETSWNLDDTSGRALIWSKINVKAMLRRALLSMALVAGVVPAQTSTSSADLYEKTIQPILSSNCLGCHNSKVKQGGLDLSTRDALLQGSEHGKVVVLGNSNDSVLYKLVAHITDPGMPFKGKKLPDASIAAISEWIKAGVPYGDAAGNAEVSIAAEAAKHWAFRVPVRPAVPAIKDPRWSRNPIDAFIAAEQRSAESLPSVRRTSGL